ncbi:MAG: hypothetical protein JKY33_09650 [Bacteroidia bacterium]|nr:hypothetical protein [Bacteroidia bacterium]
MKNIFILILILFITSCGTNDTSDAGKKRSPSKAEAIEMLESVFTGSLTQQDIKEKMGAALTMYKLPQTGENYLKVGNSLTSLRK